MPGLLDPSLDEIVRPLMQLLEKSLHTIVEEDRHTSNPVNPKRLERLGRVLNWVVKVRGWKAVGKYFNDCRLQLLRMMCSSPLPINNT